MSDSGIFKAAIKLPLEQRLTYVHQACGSNDGLRREVESLLDAHDQLDGFLADPAVNSNADVTQDLRTITEGPGTTIGPYTLLQQIGEGGFGVVYMAEQKAPIRRKVALKIIKPGMDTKEIIGRFEAERQALALMNHPNIAKVLDAGTTTTGRPYFVMELVRGTSIVEFCDDNSLSMQERLELFIPVCRAIQHAHQKAIIHRDIKPSNVLVTMHDDKAVPIVIDFGIAKALQTELTARTVFTQFRQMIGTPIYMSPEQAQMSGLDVDTRCDIYALGVLLYELLTGTTPFDPEELLQGGYDDICRRIREQEPPRPSNRVSTMDGVSRTAAAKSRKTDPDRLGWLMRGDLDWIAMKAMEKDRTRRYQTANDFAEDVRRYISGEAVLACPPTFGYRAAKFVRRYKRQVVVAAAFVSVLCLSSIAAWSLYLDARSARDDAVSQKKVAQENLITAEQQKQVAEALTVRLERQLRIANTRQLAAQSQAIRLDSPITSTLLAAKSLELSQQNQEETQARAFESLVSSLGVLGGEPLIRETSPVTCTAADSDGAWIAVGRSDGSISVCPLGKRPNLTPQTITGAHQKMIQTMVVSEGRLFSAGWDGFIRGWRIKADLSAELVIEIPCRPNSVVISPDGRWLVAKNKQLHNQLGIWDLSGKAKAPSRTYVGQSDIYEWRFTTDGRQLVTKEGHNGPNLFRVWDVETGSEVKVLRGHTAWITQFVIDGNGRRIASTCYDGTVRLWDLSDSETKEVRGLVLGKSNKAFESVAISPDNRWLAAGGDDDFIHVWDLGDSEPVSTLQLLDGHSGTISTLQFTSDSKTLISGSSDRTARVWGIHESGNFHSLAVLRGHEAPVTSIETIADPRCVVTGSADGTLRRWNLTSQNPSGSYPDMPVSSRPDYDPYSAIRVAFSNDDKWVASADLRGGIRLWRTDEIDSEPEVLRGHTPGPGVFALVFDEGGRYVFSGSGDGTVRRWDLSKKGKPSIELIAFKESKSVDAVVVAANGERIFVRRNDGLVSMWHHESDKARFVDEIRLDGMWRPPFAVHPAGTRLFTVSADGDLSEWRTTPKSIEPVGVFAKLDGGVAAMAISDQGALLAAASSSGSVHLYSISDGKVVELAVLAGDSGVESLLFSADGKRLYAGAGRVLRAWNLDQPSGSPAIVMRGHSFKSIDVTRDGTRLVSGGDGEEVPCLWWLRPDDLLQVARRKTGRKLTDEELDRFTMGTSEKQ